MSATHQAAGRMKALAKSEFEAWAGTYDRSLLNRFLFQPSYRMFLEELWAWHGESQAAFDLLDVGCGTGTFDAMLAGSPLSARVVGLDYSPAMCNIAHEKAARAGVADRLRYVSADSEHLPFADASFDAVTCSNSFHHYPHQADVVREFRRVLRPGGRLMLIDGFRDNIIGWIAFDVIVGRIEKHVFHAPWSTIHGYFQKAGFREIRRRKFNFWMPALLTVGVA
jgi:ubiquinone/menaquinone biosynthesis C-methylase UbiE